MNRPSEAEDSVLRRLADRRVTISALMSEIGSDGVSRDQAVKALMVLQQAKKVSIQEPKPYSTLGSYAWSPLSLWFWAALVAVAASGALTTVSTGVVLYARYVFGSALVLFLPGYSLIEALYPKRELDELTRLALSIGLSLALTVFVGLVLNYTPWEIRLVPIVVSLSGLTLVLLFVALYRRHQYYKLAKGIV